ncbi:DNA phosphorothioation-dependent restriction protein DptF [Metabacillus sp. B2-18]|uniref:DNA phosphorothioation-dependent restriction protein DptF n=1 Tax=Metabacillus sp. B2-18 TaxID=2897333 RepID=UPI0022AC363A|nr:DNA phosphorothioation-dependent restriction protein DptF [Metabacillus sp. B2-18]
MTKWLDLFLSNPDLSEYTMNKLSEAIIRLAYLTNSDFAEDIYDKVYRDFAKNLYFFNSGNRRGIRDYYDEVKDALFKWKGSPVKNYIYINNPNGKFRLAQSLNLRPSIEHLKFNSNEILESFRSNISMAHHNGDPNNTIFLDIDFPLYQLLLRVQEGYCPNKKDYEEAIKFVEFIEKVMSFGNKKEEMLVHFPNDNRFYKLKKDDFGAFVFERE